jgi:Zn-dependent protease with chaperone function
MSYFLLGALLSSGAFFLIYLTLSLGVVVAWRFIRNRGTGLGASFLYGLRLLPLTMAVAFIVFLVMPSFLYLEPYQTAETVSMHGLALACGGVAVVGFGLTSALSSYRKAARFVASCQGIRPVDLARSSNATVAVAGANPMVLVTGVYRPRLLISEQAVHLLDAGEMQAAIQHELAHVNFRDNLKKLVLRLCRFPFLAGLERRWMQAAELAADDAAATDESAAVDLASALVKLACHSSPAQLPELAMSLISDVDTALRLRVERLLGWQPRRKDKSQVFVTSVCITGLLMVISYIPLLHHIHDLTEMFVR